MQIEVTDCMLEQYKSIQIYFNNSPETVKLLEYVAELRCHYERKRKVPIGMCNTRRSERDIFYKHFYLAIPHMPEDFEVLNGAHPELQSFAKI